MGNAIFDLYTDFLLASFRLATATSFSQMTDARISHDNEMFRDMLHHCKRNQIKFSLILGDIWYGSSENMEYIKNKLKKDFIFPLKSNRKIALGEEEKKAGRWTPLESVEFREKEVRTIYLEGVNFPLRLIKQVFTNDDGSTGTLYLICSMQDAGREP
jgi:hypothetical protein